MALNDLQWGPFANTLVTLAVVLAYVPVDRVIGRWYDERYGHVTPVHHDRVRAVGLTLAILSTAALLIAMVLVLTTSTSWWPALPALPINAVPVVGGLLALAIHRVRSGLRGHNAVVWARSSRCPRCRSGTTMRQHREDRQPGGLMGKRPNTRAALTAAGRERIAAHWERLERLKGLSATPEPRPA